MKINKSFLIGLIITILLLGGAVVAFYLSQQNQDVRQRASEPTPAVGPFNKSLRYGSGVQTLSLSDNLNSPFTLEFWVNPTLIGQDVGTKYIIGIDDINADPPTCNNGFTVYYSEDKDVQTYHPDLSINDVTNFNTGINIPFGQWSNLAFSVDQDKNVEFFINGESVGKKQMSGELCFSKNLSLGGAKTQQVESPNIDLDELKISQGIEHSGNFTPEPQPFTPSATTLGLWHFDNELKEEFSGNITPLVSGFSFIESTLQGVTSPPVCQTTTSTCSWDPVDSAVSYHYKITEEGKDVPITEADVQAPTTSTSFTSEANKTYTCEVTASSACGVGPKGSATTTCSVAPTPTATGIPPTPTATGVPPTPTATSVPPTPTATSVPPTATGVPPTATAVPPTATAVPPTATTAPLTPTNTPVPGVATDTPTPTIASPGSPIETFAIGAGIFLTIIGALLLFAL